MASVVQKDLTMQNGDGSSLKTSTDLNTPQEKLVPSYEVGLDKEPSAETNSHLEAILGKINTLMAEANERDAALAQTYGGEAPFGASETASDDDLRLSTELKGGLSEPQTGFRPSDGPLDLMQPYTNAMKEVRDYFNEHHILRENDKLLEPNTKGEMISSSLSDTNDSFLTSHAETQTQSGAEFTPINVAREIEMSGRSFEVLKPEDMNERQFQKEIVNRMSQLEQVIGHHYGENKNLVKEAAQAAVQLTFENLDQSKLGKRVGELEALIKDLQKSQNEKDELTKETLKQFGALISKNSGPPEMPKVTTGDTEPKPLSVEKLTEGQELSDETVPKFMQGEPLDQVSLGKMSAKSTGESKGEEPAKTGMKKLTDDEVIMPGDEAEQQVTKSDTPKDIDVERIEKEIVSKSVDLRSKLNKVTMVVSDDGVHNLNRRGARPAVIITVIALLIAAAGIFASNHTEKIKKIFALVMSDESKKNQAKLNPDKVKTGVNKDQKTRRIALRGEKQLSSDRELVTGNISNRKFTGEETSKKGVGSNTRESANLQNSDDGSVHISDKFHKNPELLLPTIQGQLAMPPALIGPYSLRHAAAKGDARAQYEVAKRFANGVGVKRNYDEAVKWYMYAAAQSLAPAQYRLATFYERGRGVKKNLQRAKIWYKRAAELGNVKAMHNLAVISAAQNKNKPDYLNAIHWFKEAARRNLADSQFNLAILYHNGVGLEKNLVEAYKWFSLAARQGDRDAGKRRDLIEKKLNKNQLRQALTMLQGWKPIAVKTEANTVGLKGRHITSVMSHAKETISRSRVLTAQILLRKLGYKLNDIDGVLTEDTINSIKKFQKDKGLPPTGKITNDLVKLLNKSAI